MPNPTLTYPTPVCFQRAQKSADFDMDAYDGVLLDVVQLHSRVIEGTGLCGKGVCVYSTHTWRVMGLRVGTTEAMSRLWRATRCW